MEIPVFPVDQEAAPPTEELRGLLEEYQRRARRLQDLVQLDYIISKQGQVLREEMHTRSQDQ